VSQTKCETHVQDVALKNAEMRDPSTTHGTVITHFCVARRQGVKGSKHVVVARGEVRAVRRMFWGSPVQLRQFFLG